MYIEHMPSGEVDFDFANNAHKRPSTRIYYIYNIINISGGCRRLQVPFATEAVRPTEPTERTTEAGKVLVVQTVKSTRNQGQVKECLLPCLSSCLRRQFH